MSNLPNGHPVQVKEVPLWSVVVFLLTISFVAGGFGQQIVVLKNEQASIKQRQEQFSEINNSLIKTIGELNQAISVLKNEVKHVNRNLQDIKEGHR